MTTTDRTAGPARPVEAVHPLTEEQRRLWFLQQLHPADAGFNMYLCRRWSGPLDVTALRTALDRLTARHEPLRTRFALDGEAPVQLVEPAAPVPLDLVALAAGAGEADFTEACRPTVNAPFDLGGRPPLRAVLVSAGPHEHALALVVHHIVSDGWSFRILWRELLALYREALGEAPAGLAPLALRYGDVARAEQQRAEAGGTEAAFRYWAEKLAGTGRLRLPLDRPRPADARHPAGFATTALGPELTSALDALARRERCTPFMVLLAAYQCVLARWTGSTDFVVGTPLAGRTEAAQEELVGYFARTGVLRADLTGEPDFRTVLHRVRTATLGALSHQDVPLERLATHLGLPAEAGAAPLYQAVFVHQSQYDLAGEDGGTPLPAGVRTASMDSGFERAKTDLLLDSWRTPDGGLTLSFCFDREVLHSETVAALGTRCHALLTAAVADVTVPLHGDWLIGPDERAELLALGTGPDPRPGVLPVLDRFAARVAAAPEAPALECAGRTLSYAELDRLSDELAGRLGAVAGRPVAVRLSPSFELVTALLAIWKAGAGYLPLDPAHPEERRRLMLRESGAVALLTDEDGTGLRVVPTPAGPGTAEDLSGIAYVLYTSGSTGTPKAVAVDHAALAARVDWMAGPDGYRLTPGDRIVQFASIGFDTHAEELWPALASGACVVLLPGGGRTLPELLRGPDGPSVTVLDLPTAYWEELVSHDDRTPWPAALRLVVLGGSEVRAEAVARWRERHGDTVRLVNTYGPTEATVIVTATDLGAPDAARRPSLGRPLPGVRLYVLDERGALLPRGSEGELHIGGTGLARGYLGRPDLTAPAFPRDPFGDGRMYRTGDRARWRSDGALDYLGRGDEQVKLRGYRIEPAEIEAALTALPEVARAAAVVRGGRRLVAYAVPAPGAEPDAAALREHLTGLLPAYLVPDTVVLLDTLPLTLNGKLDTDALPEPAAATGRPYVAPRTDAEQLVAQLWQEVLGVPRVGALDDFFELGGDSLLVTRVVARIRAGVGLDVPIRDAFELSTAAALAARVEELLIAEIEALSEDEAADRLDG
ncbi:amino acid adenylation domain-containing protein [Streptomyces sp. TLI_053]|uniref:non-ribosomal peptide synthetase n=1 Tax=Streptomyces sp. TLI_053 TaxID=1855352 RepID=UPI0008799D11|nr:non-ribosomal peptide synthetase [Streptomyces sp. TLI_053]SDS96628.1 amino acid adenylation domain-containing protein [Streptomyces sp. TLI_053]